MKSTVLILDRFADSAVALLKAQSNLDVLFRVQAPATKEELQTAKAILIRTKTKVDATFLDSLPSLKVIVTATSGFDHIDLDITKKRNLQVYFCPESNQISAAEHTIGLALATMRKIIPAQKSITSGVWDRGPLMGQELSGKTWGMIGLGRIGSRVAKLAQAFEMNVIAHDPYKPDEHFKSLNVERVGVVEAFAQSDVLSFHAPLNKETRRLVKTTTLELMEPTSIIVNTARGEIVNEQDLLLALTNKVIAGAGLDVFEVEPLGKNSTLIKLPNIVLTPHIGANTHEAFDRSCLTAAQKVIDFLGGRSGIDGDPWQEEWFRAQKDC